jgi:apolipoprotein N-acyltransferase
MFSPRNSFLLIACGAIAQSGAFLWPQSFFWLSLVALVPVFYVQVQGIKKPSKAGIFWGVLFFGLFLTGLLPFLQQFAHGGFKYAAYLGLVLYFSLFSALWFWIAEKLAWYLGRIAGCFIATNLFFFVLTYLVMTPFGPLHGVPLMSPLVPLVTYSFLIKGVAYIGIHGMTMVLICFQLSIAVAAHNIVRDGLKKFLNKKNIPIASTLFGFYLILFSFGKTSDNAKLITPTPNQHVAYLAPPTNKEKFPNEVCNNVALAIAELRACRPGIQLILMPEGTCCFPLHCYASGMDQITQALGNVSLVLGSHRKDNRNNYFNCMYVITGDYKEPIYDKTYCVPFAEYVPYPWCESQMLNELFLEGHWPLTPSVEKPRICAIDSFVFTPQICYDLYFRPAPPDSQEVPIIHLTNDRWYMAYLSHLLFLLARLRAIEWGREIWYIAHTGGWRIMPDGEVLKFLGYTPANQH